MISKIKQSLKAKVSITTFSLGIVSILIFGAFSYFYLNNLQIKLLTKEMQSLSNLFVADFEDRAKLIENENKLDFIRNIHNPKGIINSFMDKHNKSSKYPVQLKLASQNPANLLFISNEKDDELINELKASGKESISIIEPDVNNIPVYYFVKGIKVEKGCLKCHGKNPSNLMGKYYDNRSTGYSEGDLIATAIFSAPIKYISEENIKTIGVFIGVLIGIFVVIVIALNILINKLVVKPVQELTKSAEEISMGELSKEIRQTSSDEIGKLQASFERMRLSLYKLMEMFDK